MSGAGEDLVQRRKARGNEGRYVFERLALDNGKKIKSAGNQIQALDLGELENALGDGFKSYDRYGL